MAKPIYPDIPVARVNDMIADELKAARAVQNWNAPTPAATAVDKQYNFQETARKLAEELREAAANICNTADNTRKQIEAITAKLIEGMDAKAKELRAHEAATDALFARVQEAIATFHGDEKEPRPENGRGS